jgi:hypothetical protein
MILIPGFPPSQHYFKNSDEALYKDIPLKFASMLQSSFKECVTCINIEWRMHVPSQELDFQRRMSCSFLCSVSEGERWLFVLLTFGGIVDHHCLNFLFIKGWWWKQTHDDDNEGRHMMMTMKADTWWWQWRQTHDDDNEGIVMKTIHMVAWTLRCDSTGGILLAIRKRENNVIRL